MSFELASPYNIEQMLNSPYISWPRAVFIGIVFVFAASSVVARQHPVLKNLNVVYQSKQIKNIKKRFYALRGKLPRGANRSSYGLQIPSPRLQNSKRLVASTMWSMLSILYIRGLHAGLQKTHEMLDKGVTPTAQDFTQIASSITEKTLASTDIWFATLLTSEMGWYQRLVGTKFPISIQGMAMHQLKGSLVSPQFAKQFAVGVRRVLRSGAATTAASWISWYFLLETMRAFRLSLSVIPAKSEALVKSYFKGVFSGLNAQPTQIQQQALMDLVFAFMAVSEENTGFMTRLMTGFHEVFFSADVAISIPLFSLGSHLCKARRAKRFCAPVAIAGAVVTTGIIKETMNPAYQELEDQLFVLSSLSQEAGNISEDILHSMRKNASNVLSSFRFGSVANAVSSFIGQAQLHPSLMTALSVNGLGKVAAAWNAGVGHLSSSWIEQEDVDQWLRDRSEIRESEVTHLLQSLSFTTEYLSLFKSKIQRVENASSAFKRSELIGIYEHLKEKQAHLVGKLKWLYKSEQYQIRNALPANSKFYATLDQHAQDLDLHFGKFFETFASDFTQFELQPLLWSMSEGGFREKRFADYLLRAQNGGDKRLALGSW